ncbi:hypothetical protein BHE74_00036827 [Ensete ventricosum]|nr:hypothetical protein BHE74_00036827 [Ensete ventricosum]
MRATSASQRTEISWAFFSSPDRRLEKVTWRLILFSIRFSCTLPLPISIDRSTQKRSSERDGEYSSRKKGGLIETGGKERPTLSSSDWLPLCANSPAIVSGRSRSSARWMDPPCPTRRSTVGVVEFGLGGGASAWVKSVDLTYVMSVVRPLTPPYLHPTSCRRRVSHVGGPTIRGHDDVAARSTSVISFPPPPGKTFSRCPTRVLEMRSCAQLLACGGIGLVPSGGSGTDWTERSLGVDSIE